MAGWFVDLWDTWMAAERVEMMVELWGVSNVLLKVDWMVIYLVDWKE
jgi:hypothetical protein